MAINFSDGTDIDSGGRIISRTSGASTLLLDDLNTVHYYTTTNSGSCNLTTGIVEGGVYEVFWMDSEDANVNFDPYIRPNNVNYGNQFTNRYLYYSQGSGTHIVVEQNTSIFYYDHVGGGLGERAAGYFKLYTERNRKHCIYHGGDTAAVVFGTGYWDNTSTVWSTIGLFAGVPGGCSLRIFVKRLA